MNEKFQNSFDDMSTSICSCSTDSTLGNCLKLINTLEVEKDKTNMAFELVLTKLDLINAKLPKNDDKKELFIIIELMKEKIQLLTEKTNDQQKMLNNLQQIQLTFIDDKNKYSLEVEQQKKKIEFLELDNQSKEEKINHLFAENKILKEEKEIKEVEYFNENKELCEDNYLLRKELDKHNFALSIIEDFNKLKYENFILSAEKSNLLKELEEYKVLKCEELNLALADFEKLKNENKNIFDEKSQLLKELEEFKAKISKFEEENNLNLTKQKYFLEEIDQLKLGNENLLKNILDKDKEISSLKEQLIIQLQEQQKEKNELELAYKDERTLRELIQSNLRKEQENKEGQIMEVSRLQSIIGFLQQQQSKTINGNSNIQKEIDLTKLMGVAGNIQPNNFTPSSAAPSVNSQFLHQSSSSAIPNYWTPCPSSFDFYGVQQQLPQSVYLFGNGGIQGLPLLSSSSLISQQTKQQNVNQQKHNNEEEVKIYRTGQHNNDDSFTTDDLTELERDNNDLLSDVSSKECFSPEIERGGNTALHGLSSSSDDCQHLFTINRRHNEEGQIEMDVSVSNLFLNSELPLKDNNGYSKSQTNISASGIVDGESISFAGHGHANISKIRRRSKSTGQIASMF